MEKDKKLFDQNIKLHIIEQAYVKPVLVWPAFEPSTLLVSWKLEKKTRGRYDQSTA